MERSLSFNSVFSAVESLKMDKQSLASKKLLILLVITLWPKTAAYRLPERCRISDKPALELQLHHKLPNDCNCDKGYKYFNGTCVPTCEPTCGENLQCIDVNTCGCNEGYTLEAGNCVPLKKCDCSMHANFYNRAKCECECKSGYKMVKGKCQAVCDPECGPKAICFEPNRCVHKNKLVLLNDGNYEFICSTGCGQNERCVDFGKCECIEDAIRNEITNECEYHCKPTCGEFSECTASNVCKCNDGYFDYGRECKPICNNCGENSECIAPGKCACEKGYHETENGCEPICAHACGANQYCHKFNECACKDGYHPINNNTSCIPNCKDSCGENEYCSEPDVCTCVEGYKKTVDNICIPICGRKCGENEVCNVSLELCECKPGLIRSNSNQNQCTCAPGYNLINDTCKPECLPSCGMHATCVAPNTCKCLNGSPYDISRPDHCPEKGEHGECFKTYHVIVACIKLHCDTSTIVIVLIYGCISILPLVAIFFAVQIYRKYKPKCQQKPAADQVVNFSTTHQRLILE